MCRTSQFPDAEPDPVFGALPLFFLFAQVLLQYGCVLIPSKCFGRIWQNYIGWDFGFPVLNSVVLTSQRASGLDVGGDVPGVLLLLLLGFWGSPLGLVVGIGPEAFPGVELVDEFDAVWGGADGATLGGGGGFDAVLELSDVSG